MEREQKDVGRGRERGKEETVPSLPSPSPSFFNLKEETTASDLNRTKAVYNGLSELGLFIISTVLYHLRLDSMHYCSFCLLIRFSSIDRKASVVTVLDFRYRKNDGNK